MTKWAVWCHATFSEYSGETGPLTRPSSNTRIDNGTKYRHTISPPQDVDRPSSILRKYAVLERYM